MPRREKLPVLAQATIAAQLAVAIRVEAKRLLKSEKHSHQGVPIYHAQHFVTMISHQVDLVEQTASAAMAALAYYEQDHEPATMEVAETLAKSAGHQVLAVKALYESLMLALSSHERNSEAHMG